MSRLLDIQEKPITNVGLDAVINKINASLAGVTWLQRQFTRAFQLPEKRRNAEFRNPRLYIGNGEYFNVISNDELTAYSFMVGKGAAGAEGVDNSVTKAVFFSKRLDLIILGRYDFVDPLRDEIFIEELTEDVLAAISAVGVRVDSVYNETINEVLEDFDLSEVERDHLYHPRFGIRIELTVNYKNSQSVC
jgi:hypothetical protein